MKNFIKKYTKILLILAIIPIVLPNYASAAPACRLTASPGDVVVSFPGTILLSNANPQSVSVTANVPAGTYNLIAETWDDHAAHGGQGQTLERVFFIGKNSSGTEVFRSSATTDIPENQNWQVSNLNSNLVIGSAITNLVARHNHVGAGGYQSIAPICLKFQKVNDPLPPPTVPELNLSCSASPSSVQVNQNVNWTANATGGNGSYTYSWTGSDSLSGTTRDFSKTYSSAGTKNASVTVVSGNQTKTANCSVTITQLPPPTSDPVASCSVSDSRVERGESVTFTASVNGGTSPYTYRWTGDLSGSGVTESRSFSSTGSYRAYLEVRDANNKVSNANCPTVVVEEDDDNDNDDLEIQCKISDSSIEEGDRVKISVDIDGGNSPYKVRWTGDADEIDDFDDRDESQTVRIDEAGRYELKVTVIDDDGERDSDTCTIRVDGEEDDDRDTRVITSTNNTPTGRLASVDSVFLSQLPYTGPEDWIKVTGFLSVVLLWSAIIGYFVTKDRKKRQISSKINAFKEANKQNKIV